MFLINNNAIFCKSNISFIWVQEILKPVFRVTQFEIESFRYTHNELLQKTARALSLITRHESLRTISMIVKSPVEICASLICNGLYYIKLSFTGIICPIHYY